MKKYIVLSSVIYTTIAAPTNYIEQLPENSFVRFAYRTEMAKAPHKRDEELAYAFAKIQATAQQLDHQTPCSPEAAQKLEAELHQHVYTTVFLSLNNAFEVEGRHFDELLTNEQILTQRKAMAIFAVKRAYKEILLFRDKKN